MTKQQKRRGNPFHTEGPIRIVWPRTFLTNLQSPLALAWSTLGVNMQLPLSGRRKKKSLDPYVVWT